MIEVVITIILLAFISLSLTKITSQASVSITAIANKAVTVQSAIRYSNLLKYDFSGSQEVYVNTSTPPSSNSCTSYSSTDTTKSWGTVTANKSFVRGLFTLNIAQVVLSTSKPESFIPISESWVGYEITQSAYNPNSSTIPEFQLWRIECNNNSGILTPKANGSQRLLMLGPVLPSLSNSSSYIGCFPGYISGNCTVNELGISASVYPTAAYAAYYRFILPYSGKNIILKTLTTTQYQNLRSRIDE